MSSSYQPSAVILVFRLIIIMHLEFFFFIMWVEEINLVLFSTIFFFFASPKSFGWIQNMTRGFVDTVGVYTLTETRRKGEGERAQSAAVTQSVRRTH